MVVISASSRRQSVQRFFVWRIVEVKNAGKCLLEWASRDAAQCLSDMQPYAGSQVAQVMSLLCYVG